MGSVPGSKSGLRSNTLKPIRISLSSACSPVESFANNEIQESAMPGGIRKGRRTQNSARLGLHILAGYGMRGRGNLLTSRIL